MTCEGEEPEQFRSSGGRVRALRWFFVAATVGAMVWFVVVGRQPASGAGILNWIQPGYVLPIPAIVVGVTAMVLVAFSPWQPASGAIAITWVAFGLARYEPLLEWVWTRGFYSTIVGLAFAGTLLSDRSRARLIRHWNQRSRWLVLLLIMLGWTLVTEFSALTRGDLFSGPKHNLCRMIESIAASAILVAVTDRKGVCFALIATAIASQLSLLLQLDAIEGASDLTFSIAPLACLIAGIATSGPALSALAFACMALLLTAIAVYTANRSGNIGLGLGYLTLAVSRITKLKHLMLVMATMLIAVAIASFSPLPQRIGEWMEKGWETPSLSSRTDFWKATLDSATKHWVLGVGPGRGGQAMSDQLGLSKWKATHSSAIEILEEQGLPGLLAWSALIVCAFYYCFRHRNDSQRWRRGIALGCGCALVAIIPAAMNLSRHDDIRLFWFLGLAFALASYDPHCHQPLGRREITGQE